MALSEIQKAILRIMYYERRYMTAKEIATEGGYSWQTVDKYLKRMFKKKFVKYKKFHSLEDPSKMRVKWMFNYTLYKKLKNMIR